MAPRIERLDLSGRLGPSPEYAYVARAEGAIVYMAGSVPVDEDGHLVGAADAEAQTRKVIENLAVALEAAGAGPDDVVKTTIYVVATRQSDLPDVWMWFSESRFVSAPSTLVGVTRLGYEGQLVEIEAIAVLP
jgi:enamine deaminase RidA (YjgF/YER057c/UK114 family)